MPTDSDKPRTAIIGAGISGLTTAKNLADHGVPYVQYESSDRIGGNWAFGNPNGHSSAYRSLHIDTSKELLSFEDFPIPESYPDFPHHSEIKAYLESYADAFGLRDHIRFETRVDRAERLPGGGWELSIDDGSTERFDALVVANGHHWDPRYPDFPGTFDGETIHSHHYIDPEDPLPLRGKRILVVGIGNSAADLVSELSHRVHRNTVFISTRSGAWVVPKYVFGRPADRLGHTLPYVPLAWQRRLLRPMAKLISGDPEKYGLPRPNHHFLEAHPTISSELLMRLGSGDATAKPNVAELMGDRVRFEDATVEEIDVIIYATGYNITFPFFDPGFLSAPDNRLPLFKRMLKPEIDDLVFMGFAQALPTLFPFVECQARMCAEYLAGTYRPPPAGEMRKAIAADERRYVGHYNTRPRHTQQVDFFDYKWRMHKRELPAGRERARRHGGVPLAGRAAQATPA